MGLVLMALAQRRAVMICATKQHCGKTSVSLGLISAARSQLAAADRSVGYMKPVGQQWVEVPAGDKARMLRVDKDAAVAHKFFGISDSMAHVSPIVISRGVTKGFLDDRMPELSEPAISARLKTAFEAITAANDFTIVEGTGHCGVGSILGWNNAKVAATLGIDVVLVANGGIGSTFDDLHLNVLACRAENASIAGIIINKCQPHKVDEVSRYLELASERFGWNVPVLACVPYAEGLTPKMQADDQQAVREVIDAYEPHLARAVALLTSERRPAPAAPPIPAFSESERAGFWTEVMLQTTEVMRACQSLAGQAAMALEVPGTASVWHQMISLAAATTLVGQAAATGMATGLKPKPKPRPSRLQWPPSKGDTRR